MAGDFHRAQRRAIASIAACQPDAAGAETNSPAVGVGREIAPRGNKWGTRCPHVGTVDVHFGRGVRWSPATAHNPYGWCTASHPARELERPGLTCGPRYAGNRAN